MDQKTAGTTKFKDLTDSIKNTICYILKINTTSTPISKLDTNLLEQSQFKINTFDTESKIELFEQCFTNYDFYKNKKPVEFNCKEAIEMLNKEVDNFVSCDENELLSEMYLTLQSLNARINKIKNKEIV